MNNTYYELRLYTENDLYYILINPYEEYDGFDWDDINGEYVLTNYDMFFKLCHFLKEKYPDRNYRVVEVQEHIMLNL